LNFAGQHPSIGAPAPVKQPSRDFAADIPIPQPDRLTRTLLDAIL